MASKELYKQVFGNREKSPLLLTFPSIFPRNIILIPGLYVLVKSLHFS